MRKIEIFGYPKPNENAIIRIESTALRDEQALHIPSMLNMAGLQNEIIRLGDRLREVAWNEEAQEALTMEIGHLKGLREEFLVLPEWARKRARSHSLKYCAIGLVAQTLERVNFHKGHDSPHNTDRLLEIAKIRLEDDGIELDAGGILHDVLTDPDCYHDMSLTGFDVILKARSRFEKLLTEQF